jgi:hypothetical protein
VDGSPTRSWLKVWRGYVTPPTRRNAQEQQRGANDEPVIWACTFPSCLREHEQRQNQFRGVRS